MAVLLSKSTLSPARRRLVERLQHLNFGWLEQLVVRRGEPLWEPAPRVIQEVKFGAENGPRPERHERDFQLKAQLVELFELFDRLRDVTIDRLDVKHGLPFRVLYEERSA